MGRLVSTRSRPENGGQSTSLKRFATREANRPDGQQAVCCNALTPGAHIRATNALKR